MIQEITFDKAKKIHKLIPEFSEDLQDQVQDRLTNTHLILGAYRKEKPAGYLIAYDRYHDGSIYCWMAGVVPEFRRKGILSKLMSRQVKWAKLKGHTKVTIKTRNNRREMIHFLTKDGWLFTKVESKENQDDNRIFLEKPL